jgi:hypothetical protein
MQQTALLPQFSLAQIPSLSWESSDIHILTRYAIYTAAKDFLVVTNSRPRIKMPFLAMDALVGAHLATTIGQTAIPDLLLTSTAELPQQPP